MEFLCFTLKALDPFDLPFYEKWPHSIPVSYSPCFDRLHHRILCLKGTKFFPKVPRNSKLKRASANKNLADPSSQMKGIK